MTPIGIMQGRLSPPGPRPQAFPWATWREEFDLARECGFDRLEWLVTADRLDDNPIWTAAAAIRECSNASGVGVTTLCADCFIERPLVRVSASERQERIDLLAKLIASASPTGIGVIVLPVLEANALRDRGEAVALLDALGEPLAVAGDLGMSLALESDWPAADLSRMIADAPPALGICHDLGNAAASGHDSVAAVRVLGDRLVAVHIKDRRRGGSSLALGQGDADLPASLDALHASGYGGALILETPAGSDPVTAARENLAFVRGHIGATSLSRS